MEEQTLRRYVDLVVRSCLRVPVGDVVAVHGEPAHRDLLVELAAASYRAGARLVDVQFVEPRVRRARVVESDAKHLELVPPWYEQRMRWVVGERGSSVSVNGPSEPRLMNGTDPLRAARERTTRVPGTRAYGRAVQRGDLRFCVIAWPLEGWAATAYPELPAAEAARRVSDDLVGFCRIAAADPPDAWDVHVERLVGRARALTGLDLDRLRFRGPAIDLELGLPPGSVWLGGEEQTTYGATFRANLPTEEVFTSPDPRRTSGTFACSRPLTLDGRRIAGIRGRFRGGRLVELEADDPADRDYLAAHVSRDRGAARLGEVALVDAGSRIGATGRTYGITLIDENAASHIAFGHGFDLARRPGAARVNGSRIHTDVMIGAPDVDVTGWTRAGRQVALIRDGLWQAELEG